MKIKNMTSHNGNKVANQFIIEDDNGNQFFQSYNTVIVKKDWSGERLQIVLDHDSWDYSVTTGKYRNLFLGETKRETESKIASGEYKLDNLND